jgi:hypothetical protein
MFHLAPDEPAQLAIARWMSGGPHWNMFDHNTWRPGMAVLLAPLFWFTDDPTRIMRGGLLIGTALGGIAAVQMARLAQRLTPLPPAACWWAAAAVAVAPSALSATAFVWAEGAVTVIFLATLAATLRCYDDPRPATGIVAITWAVLGSTAHSRLLPIVPVVVALTVGRLLVARRFRHATFVAGWAVVTTALSMIAVRAVIDAVWDDPSSSNSVGSVLRRLPRVGDELRSLTGQVWYQLTATAGLAAIGAAVLVWRAVRHPGTARRDARLVLALTSPLVAESIVFMASRTRVDHRIYGRYTDAVLWPVLVVGIGWLLRLRSTRSPGRAASLLVGVAATTAAAGWAIAVVAGEALGDGAGVRPMIAGLMPVVGTGPAIPIGSVTLTAIVVLAVFALAAAVTPRRAAPTVLAVLATAGLLFGGIRTHEALSIRLNSWQPAMEVVAIDELLPADAPLGVKFVRDSDYPAASWDDQRRRAQLYQFALPHHRFLRDRGLDDDVGPYVFAPLGDKQLSASGAKVLWRDPKVKVALWMEAG